jgi:hypothetical protein
MSVGHAQSLSDYDNSGFSVLRAFLLSEIQLSETPEGISGGWVKPGDRETQEVHPPPPAPTLRSNHRSANCQFKNIVTLFSISGGVS